LFAHITAFAIRLLHEREGLDWPRELNCCSEIGSEKKKAKGSGQSIQDRQARKNKKYACLQQARTRFMAELSGNRAGTSLIDLIVNESSGPAIRELSREGTARKSILERAGHGSTKEKTGRFYRRPCH